MSENSTRTILIVEDEMIIAARVAMLVEKLGYSVSGILPRGEEVLDHCRAARPDLILMDIQLKGGQDGVDTVHQLQREGFQIPVVYLTANSEAASFERARATRPEGFVSKPYRRRELEMALALAFSRQTDTPNFPSRNSEKLVTDRIFVRHQNKMVRLPFDQILFAEASRAYCRVVTTEGEYLLSMSLRALQDELPEQLFLRVHRSYLVNLRKIDEIDSDEILLSGRSVTLGRSYRDELLRRLKTIL